MGAAAAAVCACSSLTRSFLSCPMKDALSAAVWKRPCPNLELVSINLRLIFSRAARFVWTSSDWNLNFINYKICQTRINWFLSFVILSVLSFKDHELYHTEFFGSILCSSCERNYIICIINRGWINYLAKCDDALFWSHAASLEHDKVIVHFTVMRETTHWGDWFLSEIVLCRGIVLDDLQI